MPQYFSPVGNDQTFDANGDPLVGGQIETYLEGSSTPAATYTDATGGTPQSNPIFLNALGYPTLGAIWLTGGTGYKFIIKNAAGSTLRTIDNIVGIGDASVSQSEWVESGFVPTYITGTSFSVPGDQTAILQIGRRLRTTNTSGLVYSTISNSVFAAGITTLTLTNDSTTLDAGLSLVAYALLAADPLSVPNLPGSKITGAITASGLTMATDRILGRVSASTGAIEELTRTQLAVLSTSKLQPITATVGSNALTLTLNPTTLDFRSTTLGSGATVTRSVASAITLTVSSGSTLGTSNGVISRLAVLAMDNAGTVELAVVNLLGGVNIDESGLISTTAEGGAGGADSASTIYSTAARASLPFRIIGFVESTQATAGTWATTPSLVNGSSSPYAMWLAGYGQTIQNVIGSRALNGGPYTNNTGRRIKVYVSAIGNASADIFMTSTINSVTTNRATLSYQESGTWRFIYNSLAFDVPPGGTYAVATNNTSTLSLWTEDR